MDTKLSDKYTVVDESNLAVVGKFNTLEEAEACVVGLEFCVPDKVYAGGFGIDVPDR